MTQSKNKVILYIGLKMIGVMKMTALAKTIETLLENKKYSSLRDVLSSMNEADIAGNVFRGFFGQFTAFI